MHLSSFLRASAIAAAVVGAPAFAACSASMATPDGSGGAAPTGSTPPAPTASSETDAGPEGGDATTPRAAGCGRTATGLGAVTTKTLTAKSLARTFHVSVPAPYDANAEHPLVFVHHGAGNTTPAAMKDWLVVESAVPGAIFVYPQALARTRADGTGGSVPRWDLDGDEDLLFFDAMLGELSNAYCIDRARVFATGFSSGGNFTQQLACLRRASVRAVAVVAGPGPFSDTCDGAMAIWMTHDANDPSLPVSGARSSKAFWADENGCGKTWTNEPNAACMRNAGCSSNRPVVYCETTGVGHDMPPFAPAEIAAFFAAAR